MTNNVILPFCLITAPVASNASVSADFVELNGSSFSPNYIEVIPSGTAATLTGGFYVELDSSTGSTSGTTYPLFAFRGFAGKWDVPVVINVADKNRPSYIHIKSTFGTSVQFIINYGNKHMQNPLRSHYRGTGT